MCRGASMTIRLFVAWYDMWIGAYWDRKSRALYLLPLPMLGVRVGFGAGTDIPPDPHR